MGLWLFLAGLNGLIAVIAGAYGWHALGGDEIFAMGARYHMYHALALIAVAWLASTRAGRGAWPVHTAGAAFVLGIVLFCGSLYALSLLGTVPLEGAAPAGGAAFMVGWLMLAVTGLRQMLSRTPSG